MHGVEARVVVTCGNRSRRSYRDRVPPNPHMPVGEGRVLHATSNDVSGREHR
jgi:hypothetical protein